MANPTWAPTLAQVANHILGRTIAVNTTSDALTGTFSPATRPTDATVTQLIVEACAWVSLKTGDIITTGPTATALATEAGAVAAVRAAGMAELGAPRNRDVARANDLLAQATTMRDDLAAANKAAGAADAAEAVLMPTHHFPPAPTWADNLLI